MTEWQPIETAPKDGTEVLLWWFGRRVVGRWEDERGRKRPKPYWRTDLISVFGVAIHRAEWPTFWQSLLEPPK